MHLFIYQTKRSENVWQKKTNYFMKVIANAISCLLLLNYILNAKKKDLIFYSIFF